MTDVRTAWVARSRGAPTPFGAPLGARVDAVLEELGLVGADGRAVKGRKVDPYDSARLRAGLVRRYTLGTLVEAYRRLDDAGFECALLALADTPAD